MENSEISLRVAGGIIRQRADSIREVEIGTCNIGGRLQRKTGWPADEQLLGSARKSDGGGLGWNNFTGGENSSHIRAWGQSCRVLKKDHAQLLSRNAG